MTPDYSQLNSGDLISSQTYLLDRDTVDRYVEAVEDNSDRREGKLAPPMAVAALGLRGVVNDLQIPGGALHAGQELQFLGNVEVGETLECNAVLAQNFVRGGWRFLVVELDVKTAGGHRVMSGKSTIMVPENGA